MKVLKWWLPWALLVAVAVTVLVLGSHSSSRPSLDARVSHIAGLVRCPVCAGETAGQSQSPPAVEIRSQIRTDLQAGMTQGQILDSLVHDYGPGILEKPSTSGISLLVWVLPAVAGALGLVGLVLVLRRLAGGPRPGVTPRTRRTADERGVPEPGVPDGRVPGRRVPGAVAALGRRRILVAGTGVAVLGAGLTWALLSATAGRVDGQPITGQALGAAAVQSDLQIAAADVSKGDALSAVKEYQKILSADPNQLDALTEQGWLLAETGQPTLLQQGLSLLARAEKVDPAYGPAHVYRGIAFLSEDDYSESIPELQWYLAHNPDPQLVPQVRSALAKAQAGAARAGQAG
jgi:cytochrome c-type biogenesis protein CcmH